jgi:UDP-N-acetylmuramyl pentapeptide phosphotransferase/UDP-N-acetylglucosamine-1-phosphate transferase
LLDIFFDIFFKIKFNILALFILFYISLFFFRVLNKKNYLKEYKSLQRSHFGEIPRFGGLIIYFFLIFTNIIIIKSDLISYICISSIPLIIISLKEDLFQNTDVISRIISMIVSIIIFFLLDNTTFPEINIYGIQIILNNYPFAILFFCFSVLVIINGMNLIDGLNGLLSLNLLCQLIVLYYLSYKFSDVTFQIIFSLLIIIIFTFLIFNFPSGKFFLGDLGAYFLAFITSILTIKLFGKYNEILSWNAILILFYPSFELLFSFIRKIFYLKKNPFSADHDHLHSLIYKYNLKSSKNLKKANNFSTIFLTIFWSSPLYTIFFYENLLLIFFVILILSITYIFSYLFFLNKIKTK